MNDPEGLGSKPVGGLWASNVLAECGWKWWCEDTNFRECSEDNSFTFTLTEDANVLRIESIKDLESLPKCKSLLAEQLEVNIPWVLLDFEALQKSGVDAIEVDMNMGLYFALYGWDCDSILVMNPEVIVTENGGTDSHVQCEHWTQNDTGDEGRGSQSSVSEADSPFSKGPIACGRDEGRKEPESGKRLEDMTRMELGDYLADQLEKFPEMDVDLVKAAIREANRREAAEAVALDDAIEDYKRKVNPGEPMNITDIERLALMVMGLDILERIELRQAADLGVKALRLAGEITELEAIHLLGQERVVEAMYEEIMRKRRE
jgi:hypothetical protein